VWLGCLVFLFECACGTVMRYSVEVCGIVISESYLMIVLTLYMDRQAQKLQLDLMHLSGVELNVWVRDECVGRPI
jgi:hypothetical protein